MFRALTLTLALTALTVATSTQAVIITSSDSNPQQPTEISQTLTLDKFDSTLGTLDSASLTLTAEALSSLLLDNDSPTPTTFGYTSTAGLLFTSTPDLGIPGDFFNPTLDLLLWQELVSLDGDDGDGNGSQNGGPDEQDFGDQAANDSIVLDVSAFIADLSMAGGGSFDIGCTSTVTQLFNGGGGNIEAAQVTTAGCGALIAYDFTPAQVVPEPASLALMGLGLAGLGFARRRKLSK